MFFHGICGRFCGNSFIETAGVSPLEEDECKGFTKVFEIGTLFAGVERLQKRCHISVIFSASS